MTGRVPVIPTIVVLAAVATMIGLGFWQLGRLDEKEALLATYRDAATIREPVSWPESDAAAKQALYRRATLRCSRVIESSARAGTSAKGTPGWAQTARCALPDGGEALVLLGWTRAPEGPSWAGGTVSGIVAPGPRLVADPPVAGLSPLQHPDPGEIPNNHLAYAWQWFFFAATALVIYLLALRRRSIRPRGEGESEKDEADLAPPQD
ncbi:SURF1 family protein [Erythrobacter sp. LQ02-29]|uniref:SURF1 family protein n=1 Tax=Erythrobacter sp. LQ02-29 TaxID=2920384 RepID=UPI001F4D6065|nr:SURF1 family protein [Erythrobacter sp. LQ02-29]